MSISLIKINYELRNGIEAINSAEFWILYIANPTAPLSDLCIALYPRFLDESGKLTAVFISVYDSRDVAWNVPTSFGYGDVVHKSEKRFH